MPWCAVAGATFRIEDGPNGEKHPYFVLNDAFPIQEYGRQSCVVVNASTPRGLYDRTCILPASCHPFISHESYIFFARARVRQVPELEKIVASRIYSPGPAADIKLIKLIVSYMHNAPELDDDVREIAKRIEIQLAAKK